jgi:molecular chaperone DnaJ
MPTTRDYYEILSVERNADGEEIKRSYRRLAMKYHPDRNPGDTEAEKSFKEAAEAYEVLADPQKRKIYDTYGHDGLRGASGGPATHDFSRMNVSDIFSMFSEIFGGGMGGMGGGRQQRGPVRGYDLETEISIELEEVLSGAERDVEFERLDVCAKCTGSGAKPGSSPVKCPTCGGQGKVQQSGMGGMFRIVVPCLSCAGRGKVIREFCEHCRGKGRTPTKRKLTVKTPPGIHDGQAIRVPGEGEPPPQEVSPAGEGIRGDLHVVVRVEAHEMFQRDGDNLVAQMPVSFTQAALGAELRLPGIDGPVELRLPKGSQHADVVRVPGRGLPNLRGGKRGDVVVGVKIEIPTKLNGKQEKLLREFAESEDKRVMPESQGFWKKMGDMLGKSKQGGD